MRVLAIAMTIHQWEPLFAWLPVETLVAEHQQEYYGALGQSQQDADATRFIEFMLGIVVETLRNQISLSQSDNKPVESELDMAILALLTKHPTITQAEAAAELGVARSTLARHLAALQAAGRLRRIGARRNGHWEVAEA